MLRHIPVLTKEIFEHLPQNLTSYFDGTFGHGGHVEYLLSQLHPPYEGGMKGGSNVNVNIKVTACDLDSTIMQKGLEHTQQRETLITPLLESYAHIDQIWKKCWPFDFMLLDLGVNMEHFKDNERGFSINTNAPLDMRFAREGNRRSAKDIINSSSPQQLEKMLTTYGDFSPKTASYLSKGILEARSKAPLETTDQLKSLLHSLHCNQKKVAVVFQALRIETNQELEQLEIFLKNFSKQLKIGGRCAIITYHSIEDRIVKNAFKALAESWTLQLVNKKVIIPHYTEIQHNRAARSAKLRVIQKLT